jgi:D-amino peptidase
VRINGRPVDEVQLSTALAGHIGVPVGLVTGDDVICEETQAWLPQIETAIVKYAVDTYAAVCLPQAEAHERIRQAARRAVEKAPALEPFAFDTPIRLEVQLLSPSAAIRLTLLPGVERSTDLAVRYTSQSFEDVWRMLWAMVFIASTTRDPIPW